MTKLRMLAPGLPPGEYITVFQGVTTVEPEDSYFGNRSLELSFEAIEGENGGGVATRITTFNRPRRTNALGRTLADLKGSAIAVGEDVDPVEFVGRKYVVMIEKIIAKKKKDDGDDVNVDDDDGDDSDGGSTRIASITPFDDQAVDGFDSEEV